MKYLLDTHIILWAALDVRKLSRKAKKILEDPDNILYFSPVSLWEISIKHAKHPDQMPMTSERAKELALKMGLVELPVRSRHGVDIANLPERVDYMKVLPPEVFAVFARLREKRKELAQQAAVPPFTVATDAQLAEIAKIKEPSLAKLGAIEGIGEARLKSYGDAFLSVLAESAS